MLKPSFLPFAAAVLLCPVPADACGGGVVSSLGSQLSSDAQRIFISANGATTEVVTQIMVPNSPADYGVLIPVPAPPTLDPNPVSAADLDALDDATVPSIRIYHPTEEESDGCSCLPIAAGDDDGGSVQSLPGIRLTEPVEIGPVTAVVLSGDTPEAVDAWLQEHGFAVSDADRPILAAYSGSEQSFIAIRRNEAVSNGPSGSMGIHFTLPGDQRGLPLRFARIGAASSVAFTVFVAAQGVVGPTPPFATLSLDDLEEDLVWRDEYGAAVDDAVAGHSGRAFVIENTQSRSSLEQPPYLQGVQFSLRGSPFLQWISPGATLTRLSTRLAAGSLTEDVAFIPYDGPHPFSRTLEGDPAVRRSAHAGVLLGLLLTGALRRGVRRRRQGIAIRESQSRRDRR